MDPGEEIRFRITSETFVDTSPTGGNLGETSSVRSLPHLQSQVSNTVSLGNNTATTGNLECEGPRSEEKKVPYYIKASINEPGLGLLSWWNNS